MSYSLKKEHLINWDAQDKKPSINEDDDDTYISERSSTTSLNENTSSQNPTSKRLPTPPPNKSRKDPHPLRYHYNELPENGIPLATQADLARKEEKKKKKAIRKAPPGRGYLVPLPETNPSQQHSNYFPYAQYYQAKDPNWIMRHRQTADGQLLLYDSVDPSQYALEPALATPPLRRRRHQKSHRNHNASTTQYNPDKKAYEIAHKVAPSSHLTPYENYEQQGPSSKQFKPLKYANNEEYREQSSRQTKSQQRRQLKTENDWNDHYVKTITSKSPRDPNNLITTPNRSKQVRGNSAGDSKKHHHHAHSQQHHHRHHNSPPQTKHEHHHIHSSQSDHHHPIAAAEYVDKEFQVIDASFKKSERTLFCQQRQNPFHSTPPAIYKQNSYLPPITRDYYRRPNPADYSPISPQQKFDKESLDTPKAYKPDPQIRFYDRYLNNIIDKKLVA